MTRENITSCHLFTIRLSLFLEGVIKFSRHWCKTKLDVNLQSHLSFIDCWGTIWCFFTDHVSLKCHCKSSPVEWVLFLLLFLSQFSFHSLPYVKVKVCRCYYCKDYNRRWIFKLRFCDSVLSFKKFIDQFKWFSSLFKHLN